MRRFVKGAIAELDHSRLAEIERDLTQASPDSEAIKTKTSNLETSVEQAASYLTAHDRSRYNQASPELGDFAPFADRNSQHLKAIRQALLQTKQSAPKPAGGRFAFSKPKSSASTPVKPASTESATAALGPNLPIPYQPSDDSALVISALSKIHWQAEDLPTGASSSYVFRDINKSIINLAYLQKSTASIYIHNISESIIYAPNVLRSVIVHNAIDCAMLIGCHQFRMHASKGCAIYIHATSKPIIEHCSNLSFSPLRPPSAETTAANDNWRSVQDFDWLQSSKGDSPHWKRAPELSAESEDLLRAVLNEAKYDDSKCKDWLLSVRR